MAKLNKDQRRTRRIEQLQQRKILLESKISILQKAIQATDEELSKLQGLTDQ